MDLELAGKVALVTGVSQGLGLAVAEVLAAEGMRVAGRAISARRLKGIGVLLIPDSSMLVAWADGPASPKSPRDAGRAWITATRTVL